MLLEPGLAVSAVLAFACAEPQSRDLLLALGHCAKGERLLDPCCGCGTIPLEAAEAFGAIASGVDKSAAVVKGAIANAAAGGLDGLCDFQPGNARSLDAMFPPSTFDLVCTNAPWGLQTAVDKKSRSSEGNLLEKIYSGLVRSA